MSTSLFSDDATSGIHDVRFIRIYVTASPYEGDCCSIPGNGNVTAWDEAVVFLAGNIHSAVFIISFIGPVSTTGQV